MLTVIAAMSGQGAGQAEGTASRAEAPGVSQDKLQALVSVPATQMPAISTVVSFWTLFLACIDLNLFLGASLLQ